MIIIFYVAILFTAVESTEHQNISTKTVDAGGDVTLTCKRRSEKWGFLFWKKLVPGNLPEVLGASYTYDHDAVKTTHHFTTKQEPGTCVLSINHIKLSDTAFYYCEEILELQRTVFNVTFISVKAPEPKIKMINQKPPSVAVRPGDSVALQCSVLSQSDGQTCPDDYSVHWFRAGSDETHPRRIYVHGNGGEKCERSLEAHDQQECVYDFPWRVNSSSDAGTYYCAVVTCGHALFGKGTKLEINAPSSLSVSRGTVVLLVLLCAAFAISVTVIVLLVHKIKKLKCNSNAADVDAGVGAVPQSQPTPEDALVYSVVNFTKRRTDQRVRRSEYVKEQSNYSDVRVLGNKL